MIGCPQCQNQMDEDFGLMECPQCGHQFFVDMNGEIEAAPAEGLMEELEAPQPEVQSVENWESEAPFEEAEPEVLLSDLKGETVPPASEAWTSSAGAEEFQVEDDQAIPGSTNLPDSEVLIGDQASGAEDLGSRAGATDSGDQLSGVYEGVMPDSAVFPEGALEDGSLKYQLKIEGIDTAELREILRLVLNEKCLFLEAEGLMEGVQLGVLVLEGLSPVKASFIVQELTDSGLEVSWAQVQYQSRGDEAPFSSNL